MKKITYTAEYNTPDVTIREIDLVGFICASGDEVQLDDYTEKEISLDFE